MSRGSARSIRKRGRAGRRWIAAVTISRVRTKSGEEVELATMSAAATVSARSARLTAQPPASAAASSARARVRLATVMDLAPRL